MKSQNKCELNADIHVTNSYFSYFFLFFLKKKDKLKAADSGTNNIKLSQRYSVLCIILIDFLLFMSADLLENL